MIPGLVDAHTHVPLLPTLNEAWRHWAYNFGRPGIVEDVWGKDGVPSPQRLEEIFKEQHVDVIAPVPLAPGKPERFESTYERNGVSNLFMFFAPLHNWRHVKVTDRRTNADWAQCMKDLVDVHFPDAERIVLVQDNLSTHTPAALYTAFAPDEAKRMWDLSLLHI